MTAAISLEAVRKIAPSVFAKSAHPKMSERYLFLSTADIVEPLLREGYIITKAEQRKTRTNGRDPAFTRHMLRLRRSDAKPAVGDTVPEVLVSNAHDGQAKLVLHGGLFRFICANGLVISDGLGFRSTFRHVGDAEEVRDAIKSTVDSSKNSLKAVTAMTKRKLNQKEQSRFASSAAALTWDEQKFDPALLLASNRMEDEGDDVWRVFNRIQENLIRGGVQFVSQASQRSFRTRGITHIGRSTDLNVGLWNLAKELVKN
jgi:hypothetical protein